MKYAPADPAKIEQNVPRSLLDLPVWLHWRAFPAEDPTDKPKKVPFYVDGGPRSGQLDTPADRARLVTFECAKDRYNPNRCAGFGAALGSVSNEINVCLAGIDLDGCINPAGEIGPQAKKVVAAGHGAYAEVSPSKTGLKMFGTGNLETRKEDRFEIYSHGRYFTVTGEKIEGDQLADLTEAAALTLQLHDNQQAYEKRQSNRIPKGRRNSTVFAEAARLRAFNTEYQQARTKLLDFNAMFCDEPLKDPEVIRCLDSAWKYPPGFPLTDLGNAQRLVHRYGEDLRYLPEAGKFLTWNGSHWIMDRDGEAERWTKESARSIFDEARDSTEDERRKRLTQWALQSQSAMRIRAARELARSETGIPIKPEQLDADPMLFGVENGVIDLTTGKLREARREDYITKKAKVGFDPNARCDLWLQFLSEIMGAETAAYIQHAVGYSLTGLNIEQCLFILLGSGENGKSTFLKLITELLGDYAVVTDAQTWMKRDRKGGASNDIAALRGARLAASSETEEGQHLAEVLIKQMTGSDTVTARFLYGEYFKFDPQFKLWISANHKPVIEGDDHAIWRRIRLLPFTTTIRKDKVDKKLVSKLRKELPGILNWALQGCLVWQRDGLAMPRDVENATKDYRREMDHVGQFFDECCEFSPNKTCRAKWVTGRYKRWAAEQSIQHTLSDLKIWRRLEERGITKEKKMYGFEYYGVALLPEHQSEDRPVPRDLDSDA